MSEMRLVGSEDGDVKIQCRRKGCLVDYKHSLNSQMRQVWLEIPVPSEATPLEIDRIWHDHKIAHANLER